VNQSVGTRGPRLRSWLAPWTLRLGALVLALDYAFKRFASQASATDLDFLLGPTASLVSAATGLEFVAERGAGHVSREAHLIIAPACSGANFAIVAFTSLTLGFLGRFTSPRRALAWLPVAAGLAYAATILANAARITLALGAERGELFAPWLSGAAVHRAVGVGVYLCGLLALYGVVARALGRRGDARLPLACYVLVTLVTPVLGGVYLGPAFILHAAVVLGATTFAGAVLWLLRDRVTLGLGGEGRDVRVRRGVARARCGRERPLPGQGDATLVPPAVA